MAAAYQLAQTANQTAPFLAAVTASPNLVSALSGCLTPQEVGWAGLGWCLLVPRTRLLP